MITDKTDDWDNRHAGQPIVTNTPRQGDAPGSRDRTATSALIAERHKTHGDWDANAAASQAMKKIMNDFVHQHSIFLNPSQLEALDMICLKLSRIITGQPDFGDHWRDIAGYATLVADRCSK